MSIASARVPASIVSGIICFMLGIAGGIVIGAFVDTGLNKQAAAEVNPEVKDAGGKAGSMPGMPGMGKGGAAPGGGKGGGGKGGGGKGGGQSPKTQLSTLVVKLDTLSKKPLALELTPEQKKQVKELLADLDSKDALGDDEAKAKYEALLKLVEGQKETLEAAGYRFPGTPAAPPGDPAPNPFKEGDAANRLKSLRETLGGVAPVPPVDAKAEAAKEEYALLKTVSIKKACEAYYLNPTSGNEYPKELENLVKPPWGGSSYLNDPKSDLLDPWGNRFKYQVFTDEKENTKPYVWTERVIDGKTKVIGTKPPEKK